MSLDPVCLNRAAGVAQCTFPPMSPKPNARHLRVMVWENVEMDGGNKTMAERRTHVAILDDDQSVRTAIGRVLKISEMTVDSCATSSELFSAIAGRCPDCLVLDLQMPGMNGFDVMKFLNRRGVSIPIIVISAHDEPGSRENCLCAGATAFLRKPLDADELVKTIGDVVAAQASC
jgi:FixJ family two-component response regulator